MKPYPNSSRGRRGALSLLFLGLLCLNASAQGIITQSEPDDSIPTAKDTGLIPGSSGIKVAFGHTGDGPYGLPPGDSTGDVDFFKVTAAAGQTIYANINSAGIDPDFDSYLGIYDSAGNLLVEADDKGETSRGYERTSKATWTAVTAGDYYVCVSNWIAATSLPNDPFVPGTAPGLPGGKAGPYQLFVGLDVTTPVPQFVGGSTGYPVPAFLPVKVVGTPRYDGVLTLRNVSPGTGPSAGYTINSFSLTGPNASLFTVSNLVTPVTIPPGGELNVNISFNAAGFAGLATATLNLNSNDPFAQNFVLNTYGSPVIGGGKISVTMVKATSGTIGSMTAADDLLNGITAGTTTTAETSAINYGSGTQGHVGADFAFPGTPPELDNFAVKFTGSFSIRTAGDYTFLGYSDDGQRLVVDGEVLYSFDDYNADHFGLKNLTAGLHTFELTYFEGGGGNSVELLISKQPGEFTSYITSTWELLEAFSDDSDGDGMPNAYETSNGTNPDVNDAAVDLDADGLTNIQEYAAGTKPTVADTDADGYKDGVETKSGIWVSPTNTGSNPLVADSDADGLLDGVENLTQTTTGPTQPGTDPNKKDTDADGYADLSEITLGTDPKLLASVPTFTLQPTFTETFDAPGFHSTYLFKPFADNPPFIPGVYDSEVVSHGKVGQLTDYSTSNHNSLYFDYVDTVNSPIVQVAFDFRIGTANSDPADGFGIGLFRKSAYGSNGATNAIVTAKAWENPLGAGGYGDALFFGFGVYGTDVIRVAGPAAPTVAAATYNPPFGLANGLYNRAIITVITNGAGGSMVKLEIIEDTEGAATRRVVFDNVLIPGFTIASEEFRLIAGGRTGGSIARVELDNMSVAIPEQPTPSLVLSTTMGSLLADIYDGTTSAVNPATLQVTVNGAPLAVTPTKTGNITTASYAGAPGVFFAAGLNTAVFTYSSTTGTPYTETRTFTVDPYLLLPPSLALPASSGVTAGFNVKTYQVSPIVADATIANRIDYAEGILAGATGSPFVGGNVADLTNATNGIFHTDTINFEQDGLAFGFFGSESMVPGIPGTTFSNNNYVIESLSWVNFPTAGLYRFGVTADDGFRVSVTHAPVPALSIVTPAASARIIASVPSIASTPAGGAFGPYPAIPVTAKVVVSVPADGATALTNGAEMAGNIALIDRGTVSFGTKVKNAQNAGAIAVIIAQNAANADAMPFVMGADAAITGITIPGVMISKADGDALKALIAGPGGLTLKYGSDESTTLGKADLNTTTVFSAAVTTPGLYPLRLLNFEGGGGASVEWYSIDDAGVRHLINDTNDATALQSYSAVSSGTSISLSVVNGSIVIQFSGVLQSSPTLSGFTDVPGATSPYTVPAGSPGRMFFRARP